MTKSAMLQISDSVVADRDWLPLEVSIQVAIKEGRITDMQDPKNHVRIVSCEPVASPHDEHSGCLGQAVVPPCEHPWWKVTYDQGT